MNRIFTAIAAAISALFLVTGCGETPGSTVVIYTSQDQEFAEPILAGFTRETGIRALAVYDSESAKTVGLVNRLIAEAGRPQCDVFWNNEEFRIHQLAARDVFRETNGWAAFGYRSRRLVINTNLVSLAAAPGSLLDLTNSSWRGRLAIAYPLFGTTATHFLALRQQWGESGWAAWCRALQANKPFIVDGNSVVVKFVGGGQAAVGMTDSDDIAAGQREGMPIMALPLSGESLLIQNTIGVTRGSPHPLAAERLFAYLQSSSVARALTDARAIEGQSLAGVSPQPLRPDWNAMLRDLEPATEMLKSIFLR